MDAIDHAAALVRLYKIEHVRPGARELAHTVTASADRLHSALEALAAKKPVHPHAVEINRLENEADRVYQEAVRGLFETEKDPIMVIKWKELLRHARADHGLLRGRRERHRRRRRQARVSAVSDFPLFSAIGLIIVVALVFDYINGFHDAANSIATVVSTRVLSPGQAVVRGRRSSISSPALVVRHGGGQDRRQRAWSIWPS